MRTAVATLPEPESRHNRPHCSIAPSESGWLLVIQDDQCSVMQVFPTSEAAHLALGRMHDFFDTVKQNEHPRRTL